jgi:hypothetical protein
MGEACGSHGREIIHKKILVRKSEVTSSHKKAPFIISERLYFSTVSQSGSRLVSSLVNC